MLEPAKKGSAAVLLVVFLLAAAAGVVALKAATDRVVRRELPGSSIIYIPSGKFLKYAAFGYRALAADAIYLWSIQYYSTPTIDDRFDHLDHIFAIINELDPRFQDPYEVGALIAVDGAREVLRAPGPQPRAGREEYARSLIQAAFAILDRGAANNPDQWVYPFNAGHIALMTLKDYPLAEKYFEQCMKIPGAPEFVERLRANAMFKKGDLKTSWETWLDIYRRAPDERTKKIASNHLYNVKATIDGAALEEAAAKYRERFGRLPADLGVLVRTGFLRGGPQGPRRQGLPLRPGDGKGENGDQPMEALTLLFVAVAGLVFGSFFNVVIYRLPRGLNLSRPPSACPGCGARIKPYDNIPVLSYLILRGRCRKCGQRISPIYPAVEALTAAGFVLVYLGAGRVARPGLLRRLPLHERPHRARLHRRPSPDPARRGHLARARPGPGLRVLPRRPDLPRRAPRGGRGGRVPPPRLRGLPAHPQEGRAGHGRRDHDAHGRRLPRRPRGRSSSSSWPRSPGPSSGSASSPGGARTSSSPCPSGRSSPRRPSWP